MKLLVGATLGIALVVSGCSTSMNTMDKPMAASNMAHAHMGHVTLGWSDTPEGQGLLPVATAEAKIAAQHAGFAASKAEDLGWMQLHSHHVLHAINPSSEPKGPGLGYGVIKAAAGTAKHIKLAASSADASENVKLHALHVATAAENTQSRAEEIQRLANRVLASNSAAQAYPLVQKIQQLSAALVEGLDANGDGVITWEQGEGGLNVATKHMAIMAKGEGMH